jgi:AcrR family transcriptional regulator
VAGGAEPGRQRERIVEAMTVVAARHGYAEASVARVVKQAGMSRATFYEHFEDRDDCFLAAFRWAAAPVREEVERGREAGGEPERPRAFLSRSLKLAERYPAATRLLLIEARAGDARVRAEHEELLDLIEADIDRYLEAAAERTPPIEIPTRALLGAIGNLVAARVFRREASGLSDLLDDLLVWFGSYTLPAGRRRMTSEEWQELSRGWDEIRYDPPPLPREERSLPRGKSALSPTQVASEHRERIVEAIAACLHERGYAATTVADLVAAAGITRAAFYEQFRNKEDAFLAAQSLGLERSAGLVASRFFIEAAWPDRVWNSAEALVGYITDHADLSHANVIEAYSAGPAAIRRTIESRMAYTIFLEDGYRQRPEAETLPRISSEAIAGGTEELLRHHIVLGRTERVQELVPQAAYLTLAPFIGAAEALDFVAERCRKAAP